MVTVYLHAGLPKTGTTAIQEWLVNNAQGLRETGVFVFSHFILGHRLAVEAITDDERKAVSDIPPILATPLADVKRELIAAIHDDRISRIIISSEYFSIADPYMLKSLLADIGIDDVYALIVLRRQDRYLESNFSQIIAAMGYCNPISAEGYDSNWDWYLLATSWSRVFSRERLKLVLYETLTHERSLVSQLFYDLDPELSEFAAQCARPEERSNPSLPAALLEFKRLANQLGAVEVLPLLENAVRQGMGGPPFRMEAIVAKRLLDLYRESNRKVALEFFNRNGDLFDESDLEGGEPAGADYTGRMPVETLAMLFALYIQDQAKSQTPLADAIRRLEERISKMENNPAKLGLAGRMRTSSGNLEDRRIDNLALSQEKLRRVRFRELSLRKQLKEAREHIEILEGTLANTKESYKTKIKRLKTKQNRTWGRVQGGRLMKSAKASVASALRNAPLFGRLF